MRRTRANPSPSGHKALEEPPKKTRKQPARTAQPTTKRPREAEDDSDIEETPLPKRVKIAAKKSKPPPKSKVSKKSAPRVSSPKITEAIFSKSPHYKPQRSLIRRPIQLIEGDEDSELNIDDLDSMNPEEWKQMKLDLQYTRLTKKKLARGETLRAPSEISFEAIESVCSPRLFLFYKLSDHSLYTRIIRGHLLTISLGQGQE